MICPACGDRMQLAAFGDDDQQAKFYCQHCGYVAYQDVQPDPPGARFGHVRSAFRPAGPVVPECFR